MQYLFLKRLFDLIIGTIGMIFVFIVSLILIPCYKFDKRNRGPLFYKQARIGINGEVFYIYKFRSMVVNAEEKLKLNETLYKKYKDNNYKLEPDDDPRITKLGEFLRKTSIDELPQFINVIKGEMSIVGPRPVVKEELCEYDESKLLSVKPGIMGLWQAKGRSNIGYPERADIEMEYIDNASMLFDFKVMIKNIIVVLKKDGAY
ncbi:putative sugar transferase EpsL [Apilactobacillus kunkeei]|nr:putative sugar transferase EpsL [Apilactobacillus kunkeei]CAI2649666.1 putative sugar transferase EpsL [Apilactobacillus kunkeei]CAI2803202.1 putative sugar transferase EpsL [Apilactobacillus kunkeei]